MATVLLSAAGHAVGGALGGNVLGLSTAVLGRAVGAGVGRAIDAQIAGGGSGAVAGDSAARFRVQGAGEGQPLMRVFGRMRVAGHVFWASRFLHSTGQGGSGKGSGPAQGASGESYSVSLAIGICEGEISSIGRIWADGHEIGRDELSLQVYLGSETQLPDPKMEAIEGAGQVPAYRGLAYVVIEDLELGRFGNRVPQFNFEVTRPDVNNSGHLHLDMSRSLKAVAMIPGTGEYALATTPVHRDLGLGQKETTNLHAVGGRTDFSVSLESLTNELPECAAVSLVVSWFGDDLRCGQAQLKPKVEQHTFDGVEMPWSVSGVTRDLADQVPSVAGSSVYGGTPADAAVIEALAAIVATGKKAVFYPFLLMDQLEGNTLLDPWTGQAGQPPLPWRGRMTTSLAPGMPGTPDKTAVADAEVDAFFGQAAVSDFSWNGSAVEYSGPSEWSYRRMILHYASLCAGVGGVEAFCIGSEMRSLTQVRGASGSFPAVSKMCELLDDVRQILGGSVKLGYAADWSEYFGYHPNDGSGDLHFHLDPLWAHAELDFIGIDNYMPLSDWRDGDDHLDAGAGSIYQLDYLRSNIEGGEGYDWYYPHQTARDAQARVAISDGAYGEDWVWRYKDIRNWWMNYHYDRSAGQRQDTETAWVPMSKPIWFTEFGCAAIDKGANEPNKFLDPKSSESSQPHYSTGMRDDLMQMQYFSAIQTYWDEDAKNPVSPVYGGKMIDTSRMFAWAWDARPYPWFPAQTKIWSDFENYRRGHWLNGRSTARSLAGVIDEICREQSVDAPDTSDIHGVVRGYSASGDLTARAALQPLMNAFGIDVSQRHGKLAFNARENWVQHSIFPEQYVLENGGLELTRRSIGEVSGAVAIEFVDSGVDFELAVQSATYAEMQDENVAVSSLPLMLTHSEAKAIATRWVTEARTARDVARITLPPSMGDISAGDIVKLEGEASGSFYRVERKTLGGTIEVEATRVERDVYTPVEFDEPMSKQKGHIPILPVSPIFMDLPMITGSEVPHAPHLAVASEPWPGKVALFSSASGSGYLLNTFVAAGATIGLTQNPLVVANPATKDQGPGLTIELVSGQLQSREWADVLNGSNLVAIGDGSTDNWELFQFADATLVAENTYSVSTRLRGLFGTETQQEWPAGSLVVLIDGALQQIDLSLSQRGLDRDYLIGPASRPYSDKSYIHDNLAFSGIGLRPLAPVHLNARALPDGAQDIRWTRRTRIDGDNWSAYDVPIGEDSELYLIRFSQGGSVLREATSTQPAFVYSQAMQIADAASGLIEVAVAQISASFGPGKFQRMTMNV